MSENIMIKLEDRDRNIVRRRFYGIHLNGVKE